MKISDIYQSKGLSKEEVPLFSSKVSAGFASVADDYIEKRLDLNEALIAHPAATFFVKVEGDSMIGAGIQSNDLLIVDRAIEFKHNQVVVAVLDGEFTVKRLKKEKGHIYLYPENDKYKPIKITKEMDFKVWGVVSYAIHKL